MSRWIGQTRGIGIARGSIRSGRHAAPGLELLEARFLMSLGLAEPAPGKVGSPPAQIGPLQSLALNTDESRRLDPESSASHSPPQTPELTGGGRQEGGIELYRISLGRGPQAVRLELTWDAPGAGVSGRFWLMDEAGRRVFDRPLDGATDSRIVVHVLRPSAGDSVLYAGISTPGWVAGEGSWHLRINSEAPPSRDGGAAAGSAGQEYGPPTADSGGDSGLPASSTYLVYADPGSPDAGPGPVGEGMGPASYGGAGGNSVSGTRLSIASGPLSTSDHIPAGGFLADGGPTGTAEKEDRTRVEMSLVRLLSPQGAGWSGTQGSASDRTSVSLASYDQAIESLGETNLWSLHAGSTTSGRSAMQPSPGWTSIAAWSQPVFVDPGTSSGMPGIHSFLTGAAPADEAKQAPWVTVANLPSIGPQETASQDQGGICFSGYDRSAAALRDLLPTGDLTDIGGTSGKSVGPALLLGLNGSAALTVGLYGPELAMAFRRFASRSADQGYRVSSSRNGGPLPPLPLAGVPRLPAISRR